MRRPSNNYKVRAYMYDDDMNRTYEVVEDSEGKIWVRDTQVGKPWSQVAISPYYSTDVNHYLQRCEGNFGWRYEIV